MSKRKGARERISAWHNDRLAASGLKSWAKNVASWCFPPLTTKGQCSGWPSLLFPPTVDTETLYTSTTPLPNSKRTRINKIMNWSISVMLCATLCAWNNEFVQRLLVRRVFKSTLWCTTQPIKIGCESSSHVCSPSRYFLSTRIHTLCIILYPLLFAPSVRLYGCHYILFVCSSSFCILFLSFPVLLAQMWYWCTVGLLLVKLTNLYFTWWWDSTCHRRRHFFSRCMYHTWF